MRRGQPLGALAGKVRQEEGDLALLPVDVLECDLALREPSSRGGNTVAKFLQAASPGPNTLQQPESNLAVPHLRRLLDLLSQSITVCSSRVCTSTLTLKFIVLAFCWHRMMP